MFFALLHASVTWEIDNSGRPRKWECSRVAALVWQSWGTLPRAWLVEHLCAWGVEVRLLTKVHGRRRGDRGHKKELERRLKGEVIWRMMKYLLARDTEITVVAGFQALNLVRVLSMLMWIWWVMLLFGQPWERSEILSHICGSVSQHFARGAVTGLGCSGSGRALPNWKLMWPVGVGGVINSS